MRRPWIECETCRGWPRDGQRAATTLRATGRWRCRRCGGTSVCGEPLRWGRAQRPVSVRQWQEVQEKRTEERRVGEEGRSRWAPDHLKKKKKKRHRRTQ